MTKSAWGMGAAGVAGILLATGGVPVVEGQGSTGVIEGRVTTDVVPADAPLEVTGDHEVCGDTVPEESLIVGSGRGVANAVIVVTGTRAGGFGRAPGLLFGEGLAHRLGHRGCRFHPHVQLARPGASIEISSDDDTVHHTQARGEDGLLFAVLAQPGATMSRQLTTTGPVELTCAVHPWMRAWVFVTAEIAAMTDTDGVFRLEGVPSGPREVRIWHERLAAEPRQVFVPSGRPVTIDFDLVEPDATLATE